MSGGAIAGGEMSESDLASLAESSPAMLWRGDLSGRCVYLNARMRAFWGLTQAECQTFDWSSSVLQDDHDAVFGPFNVGMASQSAFECEGRYRRADGEIRILRTRATPYSDAAGAFAGMIGVNDLALAQAEIPFGGVKESGYGREGGAEGILNYTVVKTVSHRMAI